jgi:hypothetical protein
MSRYVLSRHPTPHTPCPWPAATPADAVLDQLPGIAAPCAALALVELLRPA